MDAHVGHLIGPQAQLRCRLHHFGFQRFDAVPLLVNRNIRQSICYGDLADDVLAIPMKGNLAGPNEITAIRPNHTVPAFASKSNRFIN